MKLSSICELLNIPKSEFEIEITQLLIDSRLLSFPMGSLFFALKTPRNNGHAYVKELYDQQVRCFVVSEHLAIYSEMPDAVFLKVDNTLLALQKIAAYRRSQFNIPVVGITGSNGKTVVKEWLFQLLHNDYNIARSPRSYNSQLGVPLSVWGIQPNTQLALIEAGISMPGEMLHLYDIIKPTIGIFTNLGDAHQENFESLEQKCVEKLVLFDDVEKLIYNCDNEIIDHLVKLKYLKTKLLSWGFSKTAHVRLLKIDKKVSSSSITCMWSNQPLEFIIPFTDHASIENAMQCIVFLLEMNYQPTLIQNRLLQLESVAMRLEIKEGNKNCILINDSYNSDINSLNIALDMLRQQSMTHNSKKTVILSDILQSSLHPTELYQRVADSIQQANVQQFIGIGNEISKYASYFINCKSLFFDDTDSFLKSGFIHNFHHDVILLKGSRKFHFEDISVRIEKIAHETILEINLNALINNLNYFRSKILPQTKVMCMVKAFAYGSGAVEVARILQHHRCNYLAVAVADEGVELRREGIRIPIVVMNPEFGSLNLLFEHNLEPEIYNFRLLNKLIQTAEKQGISNYPVHIKIDSGMHRLGFEKSEIPALIQQLKQHPEIKVCSVFSHLAGADSAEFDSFTHQQASEFKFCADQIQRAFDHKIMFHLLNSAGTERFPEYQFDMVRLGIGHFGISAIENNLLKQVCTLKTIVLQLRNIKAGETVGYNRMGKAESDIQIAILPLGYADGFNRQLSNGVGQVFINGKRAAVIGNISMDLTTVDVSNLKVSEGDFVEIFGENITISEMAGWLNTIPYEILTSVSRRVKRIYFQE